MKVAIMQPYFFPYIGYFQLVAAVDVFVFYDDVNFIKRGWINRNQIIINGKPHLFTVPVEKVSQNKKINETRIHQESFNKWRNKFLRSLTLNYEKAVNYTATATLVKSVLDTDFEEISGLAIESVIEVIKVLLPNAPQFKRSSLLEKNAFKLTGEQRIMHICKELGADIYINPIGGKDLYSKENFRRHGITLQFLEPNLFPYPQNSQIFWQGMSVIDVLMNCAWRDLTLKMMEFKLI